MKRTADRLFGDQYQLVGARRRPQPDVDRRAIGRDGRQRARRARRQPLDRPGRLAATNAEQVSKVRRIIEDLGCEPAVPDDARRVLALKGQELVEF